MTATWENNVFTISITENFKNYEYDLIGEKDKYKGELDIKCYFTCSNRTYGDKGETKLYIQQSIIDTNNHYPTFTKELYEYNFNVGIPKDFVLTQFGPISAYDVDFTNDKIYFTMDDVATEYFSIQNLGSRQKYSSNYTTSSTTLKNVMAPFKLEFTITATDVGKPTTLSSTAKVIVNVNSLGEESHPPVFSKHVYFAQYTDENELKLEEEMLIVFGSKGKITVSQSGYQEYFEISQDNSADNKINVMKLKDLPNEIIRKQFIVIDIKAKSEDADRPGRTSLIIYFTQANTGENDVKPPEFEDYLYFGKYSSDRELTINKTITLKYETSAKVTIRSQGYEEYFQVAQNTKANEQIDVKVKKPLTDEILENHFIVIYIDAATEGVDILGRTALLIYLQTNNEAIDVHPPVFSKHIFFANYTSNQLQMDEPIRVRYGATANMAVRMKGYEDYFTISQNPNIIEEIDVKFIKPLSDNIYHEDFIIIQIEAENQGLTIPGRTALLIRLNDPSKNSKNCDDGVIIWGFSGGDYIFPLLLFFASITIIVFLNIVVLSLYFKNQRMKALSQA